MAETITDPTPVRERKRRDSAAARLVPRLLDIEAAAAYLSVSPDTVRRLINSGEVSIVRMPSSRTPTGESGKRILIDRAELDELIVRWRERR